MSVSTRACPFLKRAFRPSGLTCQTEVALQFSEGCAAETALQPRGPRDRKTFMITRKKNFPPRTNSSLSLEILILGLKFSFSLETFNPGPYFSAAREGLGMKKLFSIEISFCIEISLLQYILSRLIFFNPGALWEHSLSAVLVLKSFLPKAARCNERKTALQH